MTTNSRITLVAAIAGTLFVAVTVIAAVATNNGRSRAVERPVTDTLATTVNTRCDAFTEVYDLIFQLRLEHPDIVMAQTIEESGHYSSALYIEGHNCTGMRVPSARPTTAVSTLYGHARYESVRDCIVDYALWQSSYAKGLTRDEYFALLDRTYAATEGYSDRLRRIIHDNSL